jgi:hypothetical protein
MTDPVVTTSTAPSNPTTPGILTTPAASAAPAQPRAGSITTEQFNSLPPDEQSKFAAVRRPGGGQYWIERAKLEAERADPAKPADGTQPGATPDPNTKYKFGSYEVTEAEFADLLKFKGENDLRRAAVPADPAGYKVEMPADTVMPPGMQWQFNEADPALAVARTWAHKQGLTQEQFSGLLGQYAQMEAGKEAQFRESMKGEIDKLGANGPVRVTALQTWLNGTIGPELTKSLTAGLFSERQVLALERIALKFASQGSASFSQAHREPQSNGKGPLSSMSEEQYNSTPAAERFRLSRLGH